MAIGYRSLFRVDNGLEPAEFIEEHLRTWLKEKKDKRNSPLRTAAWSGPGVHELGENAILRVVHKRVEADESQLRLYRYSEANSSGKFVVSIYAIAGGPLSKAGPNVVIEVSNPSLSPQEAVMQIATPNIVPTILDSARIVDGRTRLTGSPIVITERNSSRVIDAITDPDRTVSVIVGASPVWDADEKWCAVAEGLTKQAVGTAAIYVVDADAVSDIDAELGESHAIGKGRFRTYAPRVRLDNPDDSIRHTWLGPATLARSLTIDTAVRVKASLAYVHASTPRKRLIEGELPKNITNAMALLQREERVMLRRTSADRTVAVILKQDPVAPEKAVPTPPAFPHPQVERLSLHQPPEREPEVLQSENFVRSFVVRIKGLVEKWLPRFRADVSAVENVSDLETLIVRMGAEMETIEEQIAELETANEELQHELLTARSERDDHEEANTSLRNSNVELNDLVVVMNREIAKRNISIDAKIEERWHAPESMVELVTRLTPGYAEHEKYPLVEFTGNSTGASQMDDRYPLGQYTSTIWTYVKALHDYAERKKKTFRGDFHMYLNSPVEDGAKCPARQYAANESESVRTNNKYRSARMLPVPSAVDPSGRVFMEAHFKPAHTDTFAPRVHFYDDTSGPTGKIYIGYIGRHLPNTRT